MCWRFFVVMLCLALTGCASNSEPSYEPDSPALPFDPHPAQPGTFTNRTDHTTLSD